MLNRLIKFRIPSGEKVDSESTLWIEADAISSACQFENKRDGNSFTWIYGSEQMDSDPLIPKVIWGFSGSEFLYFFM
jgi:L-fucose isomerase-like protein